MNPIFYDAYSFYKYLYGWQHYQKVKDQTNDIVSHVFLKNLCNRLIYQVLIFKSIGLFFKQ